MANEIGITEVDAVRAEIISSIVQDTLKEEAKLIPTVSDYSSMAKKGAKSVSIPKRTQFSADDKVENTGLTAQTMSFSVDTIALDKHKAIFAKLEDIAGVQATPDVQAELIKEMAKELALQVDRDIIAELKLASAAGPDHILDYGTPGGPVALADITEARKLLNKQNVAMDNRFMMVSPEQEKAMLDIENFISAEKYGAREALLNGEIGRVFGFTVLVHNELNDVDSLFWHKSAVGYARQMESSFETDRNLGAVATEYLMHVLYGAEVLDAGKRQVYYNGLV